MLNKISDTTVDAEAMTLSGDTYGYAINGLAFQQEMIVTHLGWQYVTYYNGDKHVCLARRQLPGGNWEIIEFSDYTLSTTTDAHNVVTMGICPNDGTIHLSFDHHVSPLHYRISQSGVASDPDNITWSTALFGTVRNYLENSIPLSSFTYPEFWQTPDGNLQICYRIGSSGGGDLVMADYDGNEGLWKNTRTVIYQGGGTYTDIFGSSVERNPYQNNTSYGPDGVLHLTWCWRETAGSYANHDILYAYSKDGGYTWYNNNPSSGFRISTGGSPIQSILGISWISQGPQIIGQSTDDPGTEQLINLNSPGLTAVPIGREYGLMNTQAQAIDPQGRVHVVMWHCTPETYQGYSWSRWGPLGARRYFHYWRKENGNWQRNELPDYVGSRPRLLIGQNGDAFLIYQSRQTISLTDTGIYFADGDLTIQAATAQSEWTDWQVIHVETGPFLNEMLADPYRFQDEEILSVFVQETPSSVSQSTPLRILDFQVQ